MYDIVDKLLARELMGGEAPKKYEELFDPNNLSKLLFEFFHDGGCRTAQLVALLPSLVDALHATDADMLGAIYATQGTDTTRMGKKANTVSYVKPYGGSPSASTCFGKNLKLLLSARQCTGVSPSRNPQRISRPIHSFLLTRYAAPTHKPPNTVQLLQPHSRVMHACAGFCVCVHDACVKKRKGVCLMCKRIIFFSRDAFPPLPSHSIACAPPRSPPPHLTYSATVVYSRHVDRHIRRFNALAALLGDDRLLRVCRCCRGKHGRWHGRCGIHAPPEAQPRAARLVAARPLSPLIPIPPLLPRGRSCRCGSLVADHGFEGHARGTLLHMRMSVRGRVLGIPSHRPRRWPSERLRANRKRGVRWHGRAPNVYHSGHGNRTCTHGDVVSHGVAYEQGGPEQAFVPRQHLQI